MGEEFLKALVQTLVRQERRIAMLEVTLMHLLDHLTEEKGLLTEDEVDDLLATSERLTELEVKDRVEEVCEAFDLPLTH